MSDPNELLDFEDRDDMQQCGLGRWHHQDDDCDCYDEGTW